MLGLKEKEKEKKGKQKHDIVEQKSFNLH